jgi:hypothetical protein
MGCYEDGASFIDAQGEASFSDSELHGSAEGSAAQDGAVGT